MFGFDFFFNRRFLDSLERDVACALEDWNALLFICFPATNKLLSKLSVVNLHCSSNERILLTSKLFWLGI